jgi:beta-glucanase (GH16 family)
MSWHLTWSDEFAGTALNSSWSVRTNQSHCCGPFGGPGELQLYLPDEVSVHDGLLDIRTRRRRAVDPAGTLWNYTSGWIDTKLSFAQKYGRFEANCSLPPRNATGIWPAFWLLPTTGCWPTGGEVDIFEMVGSPLEDRTFGSYHWGTACGKDKAPIPGAGYRPKSSASDWQTGWHVYAVEWTPRGLDYYVDGEKYFSRASGDVRLPTAPMYVIFDEAVDATFPPSWGPGAYPSDGVHLLVDYVRVYEWR